jgi:diaminobutyrate-2-oxoglutarate transaminase
VRAQGWHLRTGLADLQRSTSLISDVRGLGLILGMEMAAYPAASLTAHQVAVRVQHAALQRGLILEIGGREDRVIRILPPLNVTRRTTDDALAIIASAVRAVEAELAKGGSHDSN